MFENVDPHKGQEFFANSEWLTYLMVLGISIWGGAVSYFERGRKFSWRTFIAQISSSSFAGLMVLYSCQYAGIKGPLIGVLCGVAGHMGTPALIKLAMKLKIVRDALGEKEEAK